MVSETKIDNSFPYFIECFTFVNYTAFFKQLIHSSKYCLSSDFLSLPSTTHQHFFMVV